jgi:Zn-dependent protease
MRKRPAFSIAGIPVTIHPAFFAVILVLGIVYLGTPVYLVTWVLIATASILLHEFGHAIAFRAYGLRPSVSLVGFGGLTSADSEGVDGDRFTPWRHIVVSLAGPLSALLLLGVPAYLVAEANGFDPWTSLGLRRSLDPAEVILGQVVYINVGWSLLNLLPVLPLDGGNVVAAVFEIFVKDKGRRIANVISIVIAVAASVWAVTEGYTFAPIMALFLVGMNISELSRTQTDDTDRQLSEALRALIKYDPVHAEQLAGHVLAKHPNGPRSSWAIELVAWSRLAQGDPATAHHLVATMPAGGAPSASIRGALALAGGRNAEGVTTLAWAFVHDPVVGAKALAALAVAQSGQVDAVVHELVLMGAPGLQAAGALKDLLAYCGHATDAARVDQLLAVAPRPPASYGG